LFLFFSSLENASGLPFKHIAIDGFVVLLKWFVMLNRSMDKISLYLNTIADVAEFVATIKTICNMK